MIARRTFFLASTALAGFSCLQIPVLAHRQKQVVSTILWNDRTSSLEVTHTLHVQDATLALIALGKIETPDLAPLKARALLALYVDKHFRLSSLDQKVLGLEVIGAEIEGHQVYVYQEARMKTAPGGLVVDNRILLETYPGQINRVNIDLSGTIRTLLFVLGDKAKKVLA